MTESAKKPVKQGPPQLRIPADVETHYSNMVRIAHTPAEIILDFARLLPGEPYAKVVSRVLTSPVSAKLLLKALSENLTKYEAAFGEITIPKKQSLADFLFNPPKPEDESEGE
jgi:hypothetical protein